MSRPRKAEFHIGACSVEETNVSGEQIDYSRPWKPRMDQCEEANSPFWTGAPAFPNAVDQSYHNLFIRNL